VQIPGCDIIHNLQVGDSSRKENGNRESREINIFVLAVVVVLI
jgi:hypothetical protein